MRNRPRLRPIPLCGQVQPTGLRHHGTAPVEEPLDSSAQAGEIPRSAKRRCIRSQLRLGELKPEQHQVVGKPRLHTGPLPTRTVDLSFRGVVFHEEIGLLALRKRTWWTLGGEIHQFIERHADGAFEQPQAPV